MIRILLLVALLYFAVALPSWLFLIAAFLYALLYEQTYELLVLGAVIDATFGFTASVVPYYTLAALILVLVGEYTRPLLRWNDS